jgi:2-dehydro-3-deoxygluconokinase
MIELVERPDRMLTRGFGRDTPNTAVYLARLGVATDYVTARGDDPAVARVPGLYLTQTDARGERRFAYWRDSAPVRQLFNLPDKPATEAALVGYEPALFLRHHPVAV